MFFEQLSELPQMAARTSCAVFAVPPDTPLDLPFPIYLRPDQTKTKTPVITVEALRDFLALTQNRETSERFFVIAPADALNLAAQNAFLKTLEEPRPHCHFLLLTESPSALLPTILSRVQVFYPRRHPDLTSAPAASAKTLATAKKLLTASARDLPGLATELAKTKNARETALAVVAATIELLYKSYFKTKNPKFLAKLPAFLTLYDNLQAGGHVKLHLVADLL